MTKTKPDKKLEDKKKFILEKNDQILELNPEIKEIKETFEKISLQKEDVEITYTLGEANAYLG